MKSLHCPTVFGPNDVNQQIVRMPIELNIEGDTEQTEIMLFWHGGFTSWHHFSRTVMSYSQSSRVDELIDRIVELKQTGMNLHEVAAQLNQEGVVSLRGVPFTNCILSRLLTKRGIHLRPARPCPKITLKEHEWWLPDLTNVLEMNKTTLSHWYTIRWGRGRKLPGLRGRLILQADAAELQRLQQLSNTRRRWSDCPYPADLTTPNPDPESCSVNRKGT